MAHDLPQDLDLLAGSFQHVIGISGFDRAEIDDFGRKLFARFLLDAAPNRRTDSSVAVSVWV